MKEDDWNLGTNHISIVYHVYSQLSHTYRALIGSLSGRSIHILSKLILIQGFICLYLIVDSNKR